MGFRPDRSDYVAHFTKDANIWGNIEPENGDNVGISSLSAKERLISILKSKTTYATPMPWTGAKAVCFTEWPWMSLVGYTQHYSLYGIGFKKPFIFQEWRACLLCAK